MRVYGVAFLRLQACSLVKRLIHAWPASVCRCARSGCVRALAALLACWCASALQQVTPTNHNGTPLGSCAVGYHTAARQSLSCTLLPASSHQGVSAPLPASSSLSLHVPISCSQAPRGQQQQSVLPAATQPGRSIAAQGRVLGSRDAAGRLCRAVAAGPALVASLLPAERALPRASSRPQASRPCEACWAD